MESHDGSLLRGLLNDLKRRPEDAARELGIATEEVEGLLRGELPFSAELVRRACEVWPVSPRDFARLVDDAPDGVKVMRATESRRSARVMDRNGRPYYEYRDTAASALSAFRPEWIRELLEVEADDPNDPDVRWNEGHFMHQFTYFVGPVNFYFLDDDGAKRVVAMKTGDSMCIRPFVPHSFATRRADGGGGLILALTYGGELHGDAREELRAVGSPLVEEYVLDYSSPERSVGSLIEFFREGHSMSIEELERRSRVDPHRLAELIAGKRRIDFGDLRAIARALNVRVRDLLAYDDPVPSTTVLEAGAIRAWRFETRSGSYGVHELASTPHMPMSRSLRLRIDQRDCRDYGLRFGLHQYLYNVGRTDVELAWRLGDAEHSVVLAPEDSAFVKPFVAHCFNASDGELVSLRIPSRISGGALRELSWIGADHTTRIAHETEPWFDERGRS